MYRDKLKLRAVYGSIALGARYRLLRQNWQQGQLMSYL